ncbi:branched-chain amino acid transport system II carrier protein [Salinicoccus siamensis]|uniref:Branched-chain amino acid transport system carrier protein n=1 Tax=Salinicoccus siamensis TaxID=381830 RepID=A0ABV5Z2Y1_9STAP
MTATRTSSKYQIEIYPGIAYSTYAGIFVLIGLLVSNLGLDLILKLAVPLLAFIYPVAIVLIVLSLVERVTGESRKMHQAAVFVTAVYACYEVLISVGIESETVGFLLGQTPFFEQGLGWMLPAFVAGAAGYGVDRYRRRAASGNRRNPAIQFNDDIK